MCFCLLRTTSCGDRVCPSRSLRFCACKAWIEEAEDRAEVNALIIVRAPVVLKRVLGDFHSCSSLASARHVKACASSCHETSHKVQVPTIPGGLYIYIYCLGPQNIRHVWASVSGLSTHSIRALGCAPHQMVFMYTWVYVPFFREVVAWEVSLFQYTPMYTAQILIQQHPRCPAESCDVFTAGNIWTPSASPRGKRWTNRFT